MKIKIILFWVAVVSTMVGDLVPKTAMAVTKKLYWTDNHANKIQRSNIDGSNVEDVITVGLADPVDLAVDLLGGWMYWADTSSSKIQRARLDGSSLQDIVTGLDKPFGVALDVTARKLYWTDYGTDKIQRSNMDGSNIEDLITVGLDWPQYITLDTANGMMYWGDRGTNSIRCAALDGNNVDVLVTGLDTPQGIALDVSGSKMYWTEDGANKIQRADLNGTNVEDLVLMGAAWPTGIALDLSEGKMYWADPGSGLFIRRANLDGTNIENLITQGLHVPIGLAIVPEPPCVPEMVLIPGGEFEMGDHHDGMGQSLPVHSVYIDSFCISRYEITNQQYCDYLNAAISQQPPLIEVNAGVVYAVGGSDPYCDTYSYDSDSLIDYSGGVFNVRTKDGMDMSDHPMVEVSWYGAVAYCNHYCYRLPTEAEWEYAARGGQHNPYYRYPWGDGIDGSKANYWNSGDPYETGAEPWTTPVGDYLANGYGLYDVIGNVWEWCSDWFDTGYYSVSPYDNPQGPASGAYRVCRGCSWASVADPAASCRVATRNAAMLDAREYHLGFRVVRAPEPPCTASFQGLSDLPGGDFHSNAYDVSADGSVVVGRGKTASGWEAFRWTQLGGMTGLSELPGGRFISQAFGVSPHGLVVVGYDESASGIEAFRWTEPDGMVGLGDLPGGMFYSEVFGVSADGNVVVGESHSSSGYEAIRWKDLNGNGAVDPNERLDNHPEFGLGDLPGGKFHSWSVDVSANGSVVTGNGHSASGYEVFRWTEPSGMVGLGDLPGGSFQSLVTGISADGLVIVGYGESAFGTEAFRWEDTNGNGPDPCDMVGLGDLPGGGFHSRAYDVSADGSVVVGYGTSESGRELFIWDADNGMRNLPEVLENDFGLDLTGWTLTEAYAISDDGLTIVGSGTNPDGHTEAWIARLCRRNTPPTADAGDNIQIASAEQALTVIQGTATDPDADPLEYRWLEANDVLLDWSPVDSNHATCLELGTLPYFSIGNHTLTLEVSDGQLTVSDNMVLTIDNSPPEAQAAPNYQVVEIRIDPIIVVADVADFDGDELSYRWLKEGEVLASGSVNTVHGGNTVPIPDLVVPAGDPCFPVGVHSIELRVSDGINADVNDFVSVEVTDTCAPSLSPVPSVTILWPPNHKLVPITIQANAFDNGGGAISLNVTVQSSELPDADGDGSTIPDYYIDSVDDETGLIELRLRSERSGKGDGRTYTITITATDASQNQSVAIVEILAPHDRRRK